MPLYRAFTEDFRRHMSQRSGWPLIKTVRPWFKENARGIHRTKYSNLKRGDTLNEKYAIGLVKLLLERAAAPPPDHSAAVLLQYLAAHGVSNPSQAPLSQILDCVCQPAANHPTERTATEDIIRRGIVAIGEVFNSRRLAEHHAQNCGSEQRVREAITWFYVAVGRSIRGGAPDLSADESIAVATRYIRIDLGEYQRRAIQWWRFHPWTVVLARGQKKPNGMSIVLPLSDDAYDAVINGRQMTYDCSPDQLAHPSRHVVYESLFERPLDLGAERANPTRGMFANIVCQTAVLTHHANGAPDAVRLLSFPGTPKQVNRLKAVGFRPTGKRMMATGLEFYEDVIDRRAGMFPNSIFAAVLSHFGQRITGPPRD